MTSAAARRWYLALAVAVAAFVIYGSLIPFEWRSRPLGEAWREFSTLVLSASRRRTSRTDFLANILLFVPLGFALSGALLFEQRRRWSAALGLAAGFGASLLLSTAAEFLQMFTAGRVPSGRDIVAQTLGCCAGVVLWFVFGTGVTVWIRTSLAATRTTDRRWRILTAVVIAWAIASLAPFDITVDVGDLSRRFRSGRIVLIPFGDIDTMTWRRLWDILAESLGGIPLGMLFLMGPRHRSAFHAFAGGTLVIVLMEMAQVFLRSHSASATDVLFGALGVAAGVAIARTYSTEGGAAVAGARPDARISPSMVAAAAAWVLVLAFYHWQPFDFVVDPETIRLKLARLSLLPFAAYAAGSPINALNDIVAKLGLAMPLGALAVLAMREPPRLTRTVVAVWILAGAAVFTVLELGQFLLPSRVPDVTDIWTGTAGTIAGACATIWARGGSPTPGRPHRQ